MTIRFVRGMASTRCILPILLYWLFLYIGAASGQLLPQATTNEEANVTATSATLNGEVDANLLRVTVKFEYGLSSSYGNTVTVGTVMGQDPVPVSYELTGLLSNTTYHYRVVGEYLGLLGELLRTEGEDESFTTLPLNQPPEVANSILNQTLTAGGASFTRNLNAAPAVFSDPDGDALTFTASSSAAQVAIASVSGSMLTVRPVAVGDATITVGANDGKGGARLTTFMVIVVGNELPKATTNAATNISSTSAILNGTVNPNDDSTTVTFEYGTDSNYGSTIRVEHHLTGNSDVAVRATPIDLAAKTTFHYRVAATNSSGTAYGRDTTFTTLALGSAPSVMTATAAEVCSTSATLQATVNPNGLETAILFEYGTSASYGDTMPASPGLVSGVDLVAVRADLTNLPSGVTYHYRVVASSAAGRSPGADQAFRTYPRDWPNLSTTINFPSHGNASDYQAADYRIVGLPGTGDRAVSELFAGQQNEDWAVVWDNGASSNYFIRFNGGSDFELSTGRAFWVIQRGPLQINTSAPSAPLESCQFASIPLHNGWNLITNPFLSPMPWAAVKALNGIDAPLWQYNGTAGFTESDTLKPYVGFYFDNTTALAALNVPYSPSSAVAIEVDPVKWRVHITLATGAFVDKITSFGVAHAAKSELDPFDFRKPRALAAVPTVAFHRPDWDAQYGTFATDIRPEIIDCESWEFEVRTQELGTAQLTFSGIGKIPTWYEIHLIDEGRAATINLREDSLYHFTPATETSKFSVMVGKQEVVQERLSAIALPKEFALGHNYPNPFNPETTMPVAVPSASETELVVYNMLGSKVKTIYRGTLQAGRYWFTWEGKDEAGNPVATGVYFYRLRTSTSVTLLGKMLMIR
ncbi:MAG: FlgD immunoglobulin-like domain containing protein [bacterium]